MLTPSLCSRDDNGLRPPPQHQGEFSHYNRSPQTDLDVALLCSSVGEGGGRVVQRAPPMQTRTCRRAHVDAGAGYSQDVKTRQC